MRLQLEIIDTWKRPSEFDSDGENFSFWGENGIEPAGVKQGDLGDCWLLASASALAENPSRIEKVFADRDKQDNGFYVFQFFFLSEPKYIVVDDRLPRSRYQDVPYNA